MEKTTYKVYIKTDYSNRVTAINSSAFLSDTTDWVEIDEGTGDKYHHAQGNYLQNGLMDENGSYNYIYADGVLTERSWGEKLTERLPVLIIQKKETLIAESKTKLAQWLLDNPMLFTDGKYYAVTEEKQALLNGNLASYERSEKAGIVYPLKWNSTGEVCVDWTYEDLLMLSLNIAAYVAPKVATQQTIETRVKACETLDELNAIEINYDA